MTLEMSIKNIKAIKELTLRLPLEKDFMQLLEKMQLEKVPLPCAQHRCFIILIQSSISVW